MPALIEAWRAGPWPAPGLQHLAEDDLVHLRGFDPRPLDRRLDRLTPQFVGGQAGEGPVERADWRADRGHDDDVTHGSSLLITFRLAISWNARWLLSALKRWRTLQRWAITGSGGGDAEHRGFLMPKENEAGAASGGGEKIVIQKYANRRLYNKATSSYITLEDLARMVKDGLDFEV